MERVRVAPASFKPLFEFRKLMRANEATMLINATTISNSGTLKPAATLSFAFFLEKLITCFRMLLRSYLLTLITTRNAAALGTFTKGGGRKDRRATQLLNNKRATPISQALQAALTGELSAYVTDCY